MTVVAALSGPMPKLGVVVLALLVGAALLAPRARGRAVAMLAALALAPVLLVADIWHSPQLSIVHRHPALALAAAVLAGVVVLAMALGLTRRLSLLAPLIVAALPFRIPIQAGGTTSNLLVPLYVVLAAGVLAAALAAWRERQDTDSPPPEPRRGRGGLTASWVARLLALYVLLYALQAIYSADFEKALQQMVFFYAPFAVMFTLLRDLHWTARVLRGCLELVAALAVLFAIVGFVEYATKTIILNPKLVVQNDLHAYFTVNSVFFDPDIFGRFLALVMVALLAALLHVAARREQLALSAVLGVLWVGLLLTLSRSSLGALLVGMGVLGTLRWRPSRTLWVAAAVIAVGAVAVLARPTTFGLNQGLNGASSGRAGLIGGGVHMFGERPVWGFGSGSFVIEYQREHHGTATSLAASHTIAVTIAAEQGLIGELAYLALVLVAMLVLLRGSRGDPARAAVGAAFVALMLHTNLYADFLEDPLTWALLGVGIALAAARAPAPAVARSQPERAATPAPRPAAATVRAVPNAPRH